MDAFMKVLAQQSDPALANPSISTLDNSSYQMVYLPIMAERVLHHAFKSMA